jgi:hypothetical protein
MKIELETLKEANFKNPNLKLIKSHTQTPPFQDPFVELLHFVA